MAETFPAATDVDHTTGCDDFNFRPIIRLPRARCRPPPHPLRLRKDKVVFTGGAFQLCKLGAAACYVVVQTALLVAWTRPAAYGTRASLAAAVLGLLDVLALAALSWL